MLSGSRYLLIITLAKLNFESDPEQMAGRSRKQILRGENDLEMTKRHVERDLAKHLERAPKRNLQEQT